MARNVASLRVCDRLISKAKKGSTSFLTPWRTFAAPAFSLSFRNLASLAIVHAMRTGFECG